MCEIVLYSKVCMQTKPETTLQGSTQTLKKSTLSKLTFQIKFSMAARAKPRGMCLFMCSTSESLSRIPVFLHGTLEGPLPPLTSCCMGNQALPERLKTMTTKSEGLGLTEGRRRERVCAQINTNTALMLREHFRKKKKAKHFWTFWEGPQVKTLWSKKK